MNISADTIHDTKEGKNKIFVFCACEQSLQAS